MDTLINSVVPPLGTYCFSTITNGKVSQTYHTDINEVVTAGIAASKAGKNAYYAMASFNDSSSRTQTNVAWLKSFWLDVDCKNKDPRIDYANKDDGIEAIAQFCKAQSLPMPTIVDSGNGWHVYWVLEEAITKAEWQPVANMLKTVCLEKGLRIDPACTADAARILRIPSTNNYRFDPPSLVALVKHSKPVLFDGFKGILELAYESIGAKLKIRIPGTPTKKEMSSVTEKLLGNTTASFKKIIQRSEAGAGCEHILNAIADQSGTEEPMWRAVLSVAQKCDDRDIAIHMVSNKHPEYDFATTERKASQTVGPYSCTAFDGIRLGICSSCPNYGKFTSPIQIGNTLIAATAPEVIIITPVTTPAPAPVLAMLTVASAGDIDPIASVDINKIDASLALFYVNQAKVVIPVPPKPYLRGQKGGIYKNEKLEDGTTEAKLIYDDDLYAYARLYDPEEGQVLACRLHTPKDGIRVFNIPLKSVGSRDRLRELLCSQGVAALDPVIAELSRYLMASTMELKHMHTEEKARTQMGWQEDGTFVLGTREYSKAGIRNCPPSNSTINYQKMFRMEGDMASWRKVVDVYNTKGFEVNQFVFFLALSSPLMKSIKQPGMLTTLISDESGVGKTTLGMVCNSVWGHPREMLSLPQDTLNATVNRMGVFNSVSLILDEFTNKSPEACSDIVYMATTGRGKNRSTITGVERVNNTTWNLNTFATANAALRDKISSLKASAEGENMRLFEFDMRGTPVLPKAIADTVFPLIQTNFGVAGHILASWLVENEEKLEAMVTQVQRKLDLKFKFTSKERNWSASIAGAYTMAYISKELGIHDWDITSNIDAMVIQVDKMRADVAQSITQYDALLADFLVENHSSILVVDALPDASGLLAPPRNRTINKVVARYEPDTGKLFIVAKAIRDYCVDRQFSFSSLMLLSGAKQVSKRLTLGTGVIAGSTRAVEFDTNAVGLDMDMWHDMGVEDEPIVA